MTKKTSRRKNGITHIALIVTIIVLLILAGVTIYLAVNNQGIFNKAKTATRAYNKNSSEDEQTGLDEEDKENMPKEGGSITYTDSAGKKQTLTKETPVGTKIGTTENIDGQTLNWYLFDVSDNGKTAYLVSTPTYWVPDTTKVVSGAYTPKLVSKADENTGAIRQAIQKKASGTKSTSYTYDSSSVTYNPSESSLNYYKSVNSQWSAQRESTAFASLNENEQAACYLADADIFAGIKDQVNNAEGNLKGKIQTLVGGESAEQWCKAYNKQAEVQNDKTKQITCEYSATTVPGYIYKVNGTKQQHSGAYTGAFTNENTIFGNDIYGAANKNGHTSSDNKFYNNSWWWLASPSSDDSAYVCSVDGRNSNLGDYSSPCSGGKLSLFASVAL